MLSLGEGVSVVCEPDSGLYNGLNQALGLIDSDFFAVLPSGDRCTASYWETIQEMMTLECDALFGSLLHLRLGRVLTADPSAMRERMALPHPSTVLRTDWVKKNGGFNTHYRIAADYDLLSRYLQLNPRVIVTDRVLVEYEGGGMSEKNTVLAYLEEEHIRMNIWDCDALSAMRRLNRLVEAARSIRA